MGKREIRVDLFNLYLKRELNKKNETSRTKIEKELSSKKAEYKKIIREEVENERRNTK